MGDNQVMEVPEKVTIDKFKLYTVDRLKDFLRKRGLKTSSRKDELVALAFSASVLELPLKPSIQQDNVSKANDYRNLLCVGGVQLPDPVTDLTTGWLNEKEGQSLWPPTMYADIAEYILTLTGPDKKHEELRKRLLSDYKEGKAYSYLTQNG